MPLHWRHRPLSVPQVPDLFLLQLAATTALTAQARGKLITRSLHAELLYNLSGTRHVSDHGSQQNEADCICHIVAIESGANHVCR